LDGDFDTDEPAFLLGAVEATPFEMALALARITGCANAEVHVFPRSERHCRPLLTGREAAEFDAIMRAPLQYGTARAAAFAGGGACIGKTGTNGERDAWFVGRCGEIITAVWMGRRDRGQIRMQGGQTPARTWARFMDRALELETRRARAR
jgi:membrane peptidoglycan carboxypeptidase